MYTLTDTLFPSRAPCRSKGRGFNQCLQAIAALWWSKLPHSDNTLAAGLHRWVADRPAEVWHEQQAGNARNHESRPPVNDLSDQSTCQRANGHPEGCGEIEQGNGAAALIGRVIVRNQRERSEEHTSEIQSLMRISYAV